MGGGSSGILSSGVESGRKEGSSRIMFTGLGRILYGVLILLTNHTYTELVDQSGTIIFEPELGKKNYDLICIRLQKVTKFHAHTSILFPKTD